MVCYIWRNEEFMWVMKNVFGLDGEVALIDLMSKKLDLKLSVTAPIYI